MATQIGTNAQYIDFQKTKRDGALGDLSSVPVSNVKSVGRVVMVVKWL